MSNTVAESKQEKTRQAYIDRFEKNIPVLKNRINELEQNLNSIDNDHPDKQKTRLEILTEINKAKEQIKYSENNIVSIRKMVIVRSDKVPKDIPDHNAWNDCWYDEKRNLFVTYNKYFMEIPDVGDRPHQIQYTKETGDYGVVALTDKVEFRFGYPCVVQTNSNEQDVWFLLPTMTDDMLTKNIVVSRLRPKSQKEAILYETESEQWITIGAQGLRLCEKENMISDELALYPKVPIDELRSLYNRN